MTNGGGQKHVTKKPNKAKERKKATRTQAGKAWVAKVANGPPAKG